jgi:hypothetical protein
MLLAEICTRALAPLNPLPKLALSTWKSDCFLFEDKQEIGLCVLVELPSSLACCLIMEINPVTAT